MHSAVVAYLAKRRQGSASCKTRAEVRGGGAKPWRQKGTGRARAGTIRSPLFKGGGVIFAHKAKDFSKKINKKTKVLAIKSALTTKANEGKLIIIDDLKMNQLLTKVDEKFVKMTKTAIDILKNLKSESTLIVNENVSIDNIDNFENYELIKRSFNNIPKVNVIQAKYINVHRVLKYDTLVLTKTALKNIEEAYNEK
jgi:large subunit ribosomal protein L4